MAGLIGMFLGALLAVYFVSLLFRWVLNRVRLDRRLGERGIACVAVALAAAAGFVLSGYGAADGGPPDYRWAWLYIVAGAPALLMMLSRSETSGDADSRS